MIYDFEKELRKLKAEWKDNSDELHLLFSIAKEIVFERDMDKLLDKIVDRSAQVLRAEAASLLLWNAKTMKLDFKIVKGQNAQAIRNLDVHLRPGEGLAGWVAAKGQYAVANDAENDSRFKPEIDWLTGYQTKNLLVVPMKAQEKTLGVIEVINRFGDKGFTEHDAEFLGSIAWLASMAISNAQTLRELELSQQYLANILSNLPGGFIGIDMEGDITHCNMRALDILALKDDVVGRSFENVLARHKDAVGAIRSAFKERHGDKRQIFTASVPGKGERKIGYSTLLILTDKGDLQGVGLLFQDITDFTR